VSRRKRMIEELGQDIRDHITIETQDNIERGMTPEEARHAALRKFGNIAKVKDETHEVWSVTRLERLLQDVCFGVRTLCKNPGYAIAARVMAAAANLRRMRGRPQLQLEPHQLDSRPVDPVRLAIGGPHLVHLST
jgi:hypothetical protein